MISRNSIQQVLSLAQVEEIIEDFVSLKRRGVNLIGLCPFHDEKTPSFTVSPSKNLFKCFGCGKGGDSARFLMEHEQMNFPEAIRYLAARYNVELEESSKEDSEKYEEEKKLQDSLFIINDFALASFKENFKNSSIATGYVKERGYLENTIQKFEIGYADNNYESLSKSAKAKSYNIELFQKLGLVNKNEKDFFNDRIIFPIHNLSGKVIAFAGRVLKTQEKAPKYLNSPESEIYLKRRILYGIFQAKKSIRKKNNCFLVEGYTDVMSLTQIGIENVVASSGTSLTTDQVRLIKRFTDNVTILYDGDTAGVNAALRGLDIVLEQDMNVKLVILPENEDPDSFAKANGISGFEEYVEKEAKDFVLFKTELLLSESGNDPVKKSEALKQIVDSLAHIHDSLKRSLYIKQCSQQLEVSESILVKAVNKKIRNKIVRKKQEAERAQFRKETKDQSFNEFDQITSEPSVSQDNLRFSQTDEYQEKDLVRVIMQSGSKLIDEQTTVLEYIYNNVENVLDFFDNELYKSVIKESFTEQSRGTEINSFYYLNHENTAFQELALDLLSSKHEFANWFEKGLGLVTQKMPDENFTKDSLGAINRLLTRKIDDVLTILRGRLEETPTDSEERLTLLKAVLKVQEQKREIISEQGSIGIRKV